MFAESYALKKGKFSLVTAGTVLSLLVGMSGGALAATTSTLPTSGGLLIGNIFYSFMYIAENTSVVQAALNTAGISNVTLDLGGSMANLASFIATGNVSNTAFASYAKSYPATIPSGVTVDDVQNGTVVTATYATSTVSVSGSTTSSITSTGTTTGATSGMVSTTGTWTQVETIPGQVNGNGINIQEFIGNNNSLAIYGSAISSSTATSTPIWMFSNGAWTSMGSIPASNSSVQFWTDNNNDLYALTFSDTSGTNNTVWSYSNGNWTQMTDVPNGVSSFWQDNNGSLYAITGSSNGSSTVWVSSNGTMSGTWTQESGWPSGISSLSWPDNSGIMYAVTNNFANGNTISTVYSYSNGAWTNIGQTPGYGEYIFSAGGSLYFLDAITTSGSTSTTQTVYSINGNMLTPVSGLPANLNWVTFVNDTLYAICNTGIFMNNNGNWVALPGSSSVVSGNQIMALWKSNDVLYAMIFHSSPSNSITKYSLWSYQ
jgi:hypothetical protein